MRTALAAIASTYEDPSEVVTMYQQDQRLMNSLRARVMDEQVASGRSAPRSPGRAQLPEILQPGS